MTEFILCPECWRQLEINGKSPEIMQMTIDRLTMRISELEGRVKEFESKDRKRKQKNRKGGAE